MQRKRNLRAPGRAVLTKVTLACVAIASFSIWRGPKFFWGIPLRSNLSHVAESVPNLGFDHIYVITLPGKVDRRHAMDKLALALGLQFTYVTAVASTDPAIGWISERVHEVRTRKHEILARSGLVAAKSLGGQDIDSVWLMPSQDISPSSRVRLTPDPYHPSLRGLVFPSLAEPRWGGNDWVSYFDTEYGTGATLEPEDAHINVTDLLWDPLETYPNRQATAGTIACWLSHVQALKMMRENGDHSALILEDDVDLEFDIDRLWSSISRWLPEGGPTTLPGEAGFTYSHLLSLLSILLFTKVSVNCLQRGSFSGVHGRRQDERKFDNFCPLYFVDFAPSLQFQDDGKKGLGPIVLSLSLGAPGVLRFRRKNQESGSQGAVKEPTSHTPAPSTSVIAAPQPHPFPSPRAKTPKRIEEKKVQQNVTILTLDLHHGHDTVMEGVKVNLTLCLLS
ncbi:hypothetical protein P7C70_g1647, partial [Phenoliferia sp. Uapishka_3]